MPNGQKNTTPHSNTQQRGASYPAQKWLASLAFIMMAIAWRPSTAANVVGGQQSLFKLLPQKDVIFTESLLQEVTARSKTVCALKCAGNGCCAMFTFQAGDDADYDADEGVSGKCRLHSRVQQSTPFSSQQEVMGARSYALNKTDFGQCDNGYSAWCDHCLMMGERTLNSTLAAQQCQGLDAGEVVKIKTPSDVDSVVAFTLLKDGQCTSLWVGAIKVDSQEYGDPYFEWKDGTFIPTDSALWGLDQPDFQTDSDCVVLQTESSRLTTANCQHQQNGTGKGEEGGGVCVLCQHPSDQ